MSIEHLNALAQGVRLSQYEMLGILGAGGFGITYKARDTMLDTLVAIKEYLPGDFAVRQGDSSVTAKSSTSKGDFDWGLSRFLDEARVLAKFRHPNIVRVNQIFEANNTAYIVMEYAEGESLDELLKRAGTLSEQQTKDILFPILDGLKRVHELGFLHRDIKPANIIIRHEGGAVLIDFGAARQAVETKSRAITSIVTEGYAPLEQYDPSGNQGAWTDIYALGGLAYKCVTGIKPPAATSRVRNDPLTPLAIAAAGRVSEPFALAVDAALRVFEDQRPQSIAEFLAIMSGTALPRAAAAPDDATRAMPLAETRVLRSGSISGPRSGFPMSAPLASAPVREASVAAPSAPALSVSPPPVAQKPNRTPVLVGAAAAVVLLLAGGAWFLGRSADAPPPVAQQTAANDVAPAEPPAAPPVAAPAPAEQASAAPAPAAPLGAVPAEPKRADAAPAARQVAPNQQTASVQAAPAPPPPPQFHPSFDCAKAGNQAERIVCSDSELSFLDVKMADLYKLGLASVADTNELNGEHVTFLTRRDACGDKQCVTAAYNDGIKDLERWVRK